MTAMGAFQPKREATQSCHWLASALLLIAPHQASAMPWLLAQLRAMV